MHLHILAIGRAKKSPEASITADYLGRLPKGSSLFEAESRLPYGPARAKDESDKLLSLCASPDLAQMISKWRDHGVGACYFAIGGADGHSQHLLDTADEIISFGAATWPHMLFRAMLAEQLYRAETIIANHPYHKL